MIPYLIGGTLATLISSNILHSLTENIINTICASASFIRKGTESNKMIMVIQQQIYEMDIPIKLKLVQTLLEKEPKKEINTILEDGLVEIVFKIKSILEWIEYEIKKHTTKWFANYRSINITDKLDELGHLVKILDSRILLLMTNRGNNNA